MKALILSCGTGGGHNDAGLGLAQALERRGHTTVFLNQYLGLAGKQVDKLICGLYMNTVTRSPALFRAVYGIGRGVGTLFHQLHIQSPVYYANSGRLADALGKLILSERFDAVLMPHLYPAETMTALKRQGISLPPTIAVATDHVSIPFWEETDCDWYVVPDVQSGADFVRRGVSEEKLFCAGIPAPEAFFPPSAKEREEIRKALGFSPEEKYILLMGGSMGAGNIEQLVMKLRRKTDAQTRLIVVCGKNEELRARLELFAQIDQRITVFGYLTETAKYMKACDLLFTKPGGLSTTEAALCRIPTVLLPAISQCEDANRRFFLKGRAACQGADDDQRIERGLKLLISENAQRMRKAQARLIPENPAVRIAEFTERAVTGK